MSKALGGLDWAMVLPFVIRALVSVGQFDAVLTQEIRKEIAEGTGGVAFGQVCCAVLCGVWVVLCCNVHRGVLNFDLL